MGNDASRLKASRAAAAMAALRRGKKLAQPATKTNNIGGDSSAKFIENYEYSKRAE